MNDPSIVGLFVLCTLYLWLGVFCLRQFLATRRAWPAPHPLRGKLLAIHAVVASIATCRLVTFVLAYSTSTSGQLQDVRSLVLGDLPGLAFVCAMAAFLGDHLHAWARREQQTATRAGRCGAPGDVPDGIRAALWGVCGAGALGWLICAVFLSSPLTEDASRRVDIARDIIFCTLFFALALAAVVAAAAVSRLLPDASCARTFGVDRAALRAADAALALALLLRGSVVATIDVVSGGTGNSVVLLPDSSPNAVSISVVYYTLCEVVPAAVWAFVFRSRLFSEEHSVLLERAVLPRGFEIDASELHGLQPLGSGGFGVVYSGTYRATRVAVKKFMLREHQLAAAQVRGWVRRVARVRAAAGDARGRCWCTFPLSVAIAPARSLAVVVPRAPRP